MRITISLAAIALISASVCAHDFWIRPASFCPAPHSVLDVHLEVGHGGEFERFARNPKRIAKFIIAGPGANGPVRDIPGEPGAEPAGTVTLQATGVHVVGYRSNHAKSELPADKFESYLAEEGLTGISKEK